MKKKRKNFNNGFFKVIFFVFLLLDIKLKKSIRNRNQKRSANWIFFFSTEKHIGIIIFDFWTYLKIFILMYQISVIFFQEYKYITFSKK